MSMPVSIVSSYLAKLVCIMKVTVLTQLWISILFFIGGEKCAGCRAFFLRKLSSGFSEEHWRLSPSLRCSFFYLC